MLSCKLLVIGCRPPAEIPTFGVCSSVGLGNRDEDPGVGNLDSGLGIQDSGLGTRDWRIESRQPTAGSHKSTAKSSDFLQISSQRILPFRQPCEAGLIQ